MSDESTRAEVGPKIEVSVYGMKKKDLRVFHVFTQRIRSDVLFIEAKFVGRVQPVLIASGTFEDLTSLMFSTRLGSPKAVSYIDIEIPTPKDLHEGHIFGQSYDMTWRGFVVGQKIYEKIYSDFSMIWTCTTRKPKKTLQVTERTHGSVS